MTEKVKALQLADALVCHAQLGGGDLEDLEQAAMVLRSQHQNHIKAWEIIHQQGVELTALRKQRDELLEALRRITTVNAMDYEYQAWARAAIAKAEAKT